MKKIIRVETDRKHFLRIVFFKDFYIYFTFVNQNWVILILVFQF